MFQWSILPSKVSTYKKAINRLRSMCLRIQFLCSYLSNSIGEQAQHGKGDMCCGNLFLAQLVSFRLSCIWMTPFHFKLQLSNLLCLIFRFSVQFIVTCVYNCKYWQARLFSSIYWKWAADIIRFRFLSISILRAMNTDGDVYLLRNVLPRQTVWDSGALFYK